MRFELFSELLFFISCHVPGGYYSDQVFAHGKRYEKHPTGLGTSQYEISALMLRVIFIESKQQWLIKEHFLTFGIGNSVKMPVFLRITFVPLESVTAGR
jgi:hypothetical protein